MLVRRSRFDGETAKKILVSAGTEFGMLESDEAFVQLEKLVRTAVPIERVRSGDRGTTEATTQVIVGEQRL